MKLFISLLLLGCSGPAFTEQELYAEGNNTPALGGSSGEGSERGGSSSISGENTGAIGGILEHGGGDSGGMAASPSASGSGGTTALAGGPTMGEGGSGENYSGGPAGGSDSAAGLSQCLMDHQTLACASVCNSKPECQGILDCFVRTNSNLTSDCPGFSTTGYALAAQAERNCCHD